MLRSKYHERFWMQKSESQKLKTKALELKPLNFQAILCDWWQEIFEQRYVWWSSALCKLILVSKVHGTSPPLLSESLGWRKGWESQEKSKLHKKAKQPHRLPLLFCLSLKKTYHILLLKSCFFLAKLTGAKEPWQHNFVFFGIKTRHTVTCSSGSQ